MNKRCCFRTCSHRKQVHYSIEIAYHEPLPISSNNCLNIVQNKYQNTEQTPQNSYFLIFKYASAYLLRGARHALHDTIHLRTSAIRRRLYLGRRLDSHQNEFALLATYRGGSLIFFQDKSINPSHSHFVSNQFQNLYMIPPQRKNSTINTHMGVSD